MRLEILVVVRPHVGSVVFFRHWHLLARRSLRNPTAGEAAGVDMRLPSIPLRPRCTQIPSWAGRAPPIIGWPVRPSAFSLPGVRLPTWHPWSGTRAWVDGAVDPSDGARGRSRPAERPTQSRSSSERRTADVLAQANPHIVALTSQSRARIAVSCASGLGSRGRLIGDVLAIERGGLGIGREKDGCACTALWRAKERAWPARRARGCTTGRCASNSCVRRPGAGSWR